MKKIEFERLKAFVFILARDYVPFGEINDIILNQVDKITQAPEYENVNREAYAEHQANRILGRVA